MDPTPEKSVAVRIEQREPKTKKKNSRSKKETPSVSTRPGYSLHWLTHTNDRFLHTSALLCTAPPVGEGLACMRFLAWDARVCLCVLSALFPAPVGEGLGCRCFLAWDVSMCVRVLSALFPAPWRVVASDVSVCLRALFALFPAPSVRRVHSTWTQVDILEHPRWKQEMRRRRQKERYLNTRLKGQRRNGQTLHKQNCVHVIQFSIYTDI